MELRRPTNSKLFFPLKNSAMKLRILCTFIGGMFALAVNAQRPSIYYQLDICSQYYPGCYVLVEKCRQVGTESCDVGTQIPCSEVCNNLDPLR